MKHTCMECGTHVENGVNGWIEFLPEENHTECLCNDCVQKFYAQYDHPIEQQCISCGSMVSRTNHDLCSTCFEQIVLDPMDDLPF